MSVIDLGKARRKRDVERRWRCEPAAAVVLLTEAGKIAAFAGRPERLPADTLRRAWRPLTPEQVADLVAYFERRGQT